MSRAALMRVLGAALSGTLFSVVVAGCAQSSNGAPEETADNAGAANGGAGGVVGTGGAMALAGQAGSAAASETAGAGGAFAVSGAGGVSGGLASSGTGGADLGGSAGIGGSNGGSSGNGGLAARGGAGGTGGMNETQSGGTGGTGGSAVSTGPCDIYASGSTPCVAAHSTVRALYGAYNGNLYQVTRASDKTTKDIGLLHAGGFANAATQDTFCAGTTCTISIIYDQSGKNNHLKDAPPGGNKKVSDNLADATALKLSVGGHSVYAVHIPPGVGYRDDATSGIAIGDQPETLYMVTSGDYSNDGCCFDYGNAETNNKADGAATMEAIYFGSKTEWGKGFGNGPWIMADLEVGLFAGQSFAANNNNIPPTSTYVTAVVKGRSGSFAIKSGDAASGALTTFYDGPRPTGYNPMKKQGAIVLGIGGDDSNVSEGNFFEGVMTSGASTDAIDNAVQANIVAAGYGR